MPRPDQERPALPPGVSNILDNVIYLRPDQRPKAETVWIGEPSAPVPGWWKCPSCGRRRDRGGSTVTEVWCAMGHKAAKMEVIGI